MRTKPILITLGVAAALALGGGYTAYELIGKGIHSGDLCAQFKRFEENTNRDLPRKTDNATTMVQVRVNCDLTSVTYVKRIEADPNLLAAGWKERKQRQHTQLHCNKVGLASASNWTAIDMVYGPENEFLVELRTTPEGCV